MLRQTERALDGSHSELEAEAATAQVVRLPSAALPLANATRARGFPSALAGAIVGDPEQADCPKLSPRETECLEWTAQGKTTWEIAQILELSDSTVNYYIRNAMKKLAVHTKAHAVSKAAVLGMFG